ncbi:MAG TPA: hypothetical protein DCO68_13295 [Methylophilaceae bacterium]|nr:hypothetical protein [Methylophilaceae bacterium]HAJ73041.1 hypothetical protein [Methylophilaceae bacterium]
MSFISALCKHAWLAITLKHHGTGMPTKIPAATMLVSLYIILTFANQSTQEITISSVIALSFIAQFYVFSLRNKLIGLIILIGIVSNATTLLVTFLTGIPAQQLFVITIMEYVMISSAVINVIKSNFKPY